jgi:integrase
MSIDAQTVAALRAHRSRQLEERMSVGFGRPSGAELVFSKPDGSPIHHPEYVTDAFKRHVKAAGLKKIRLHELRHTYATLALASGMRPRDISERLGHYSVAFTLDTYARWMPGAEQVAAEAAARFILGL